MTFFNNLSLRKKLSLAMLGSTLFSLIIVGYFSFQYGTNSLTETTLAAGKDDVRAHAQQIERYLTNVAEDVLFLNGTPPIQGILRARANENVDPKDGSTTGLWVKRFETISTSLMQEKPQYQHIAILDSTGAELTRVDRRGKTLEKSGGQAGYQNQGDTEYFKDTLQLGPKQVNVSQVNLVQDQGRAITPHEPIVRFSTPVVDAQQQTRGMVVITVLANSFLDWLPREHEHGWQFSLVNENGFFLRHGDQAWEWGGVLPDRRGRTAASHFGEITSQLLGGQAGHWNEFGEPNLYMTSPIQLGNTKTWNLVLAIPNTAISAQMSDFKWTLLGVLLVSLLLGEVIAIFLVRPIIQPIARAKNVLWNAAQGDLTGRFESTTSDEIGQMSQAFNQFMDNLAMIMGKVKEVAESTTTQVQNLTGRTFEVSTGSEVQTTQATQVATAVEEMSATLNDMANNSQNLSADAKDVEQAAHHGGEVVAESINGMQSLSASIQESAQRVSQLGQHSQQIGEIIRVIEEIADQTNLLALNAAIEAARAGEQGRGFAVVADEVRKLAERTSKATKEIAGVIQTVQNGTNEAVAAMEAGTTEVEQGMKRVNEAGTELNNIVAGVLRVTDMVQHIATAIEEQSMVTKEIAENVQTVATLSQDNNRDVEEVNAIANHISSQANDLHGAVGNFILKKQGDDVSLF